MDSALISKYLQKRYLIIGLICIALLFFLYGMIQLFAGSQHADGMTFQAGSAKQGTVQNPAKQAVAGVATSNNLGQKTLMVDVSGAVVNPGVYQLPDGSRIKDALAASGGVSDQANKAFVSQHINLAGKVIDAMKLYIPFATDTVPVSQDATGAGNAGSEVSSGQININTASEQQLDSLPGVGSVTAGKIIAARPYNSPDDLLSKKVVSKSVFDKIKDKISVF